MDDTEDDVRYPSNPYTGNYQSSHGHKLPQRNPSSYCQTIGDEDEDEDEEEEEEEEEVEGEEEEQEEEEEEEEDEEDNGVRREEAEEDEEEDEVDVIEDDDDDDTDDEEDEDRNGDGRDDISKDLYGRRSGIGEKESGRQRKKRKFKNLGYEFAPRVVTPPVTAAITASASVPRPAFGRNLQADWTESASFLLLDAWGDRFVQLGRKSLRSDEWHEVARKVSQASKVMRTDAQCRNRLDTLKKKYKKEKMMMAETGEAGSKWVYFKKMDALLSSLAKPGLSCGLDSGEYVFMNGRDYNSRRSNGLDEMRDSPANSESSAHEEDDSDGLPPKRPRSSRGGRGGSSFRLLADSIHKFGEIYEKIENNKRQQMVELEKMRMEFHRDLELQKRKIMERAQAEIAKICQGDDEEFDVSTENTSG